VYLEDLVAVEKLVLIANDGETFFLHGDDGPCCLGMFLFRFEAGNLVYLAECGLKAEQKNTGGNSTLYQIFTPP
jgi:hypothetical protein